MIWGSLGKPQHSQISQNTLGSLPMAYTILLASSELGGVVHTEQYRISRFTTRQDSIGAHLG